MQERQRTVSDKLSGFSDPCARPERGDPEKEQSVSFDDMQRGFSFGQVEALLRKIYSAGGGKDGGAEAFRKILSSDLVIKLEYAAKTQVDRSGRCIPSELGVESPVVDASREFRFTFQPDPNFEYVLAETKKFFGFEIPLTASEVEARYQAALAKVTEYRRLRKFVDGIHLPFVIPQTEIFDLGAAMGQCVRVAKRAYEKCFPNSSFVHDQEGSCAGRVTIASESRYDRLVEAMTHGPVVGVYFPAALQGFNLPASREAITQLPEEFLLSGAFDGLAAFVAQVSFFSDLRRPELIFSAMSFAERHTFSLRASSEGAVFGSTSMVESNDRLAVGLSVLG